MPLLELTDLSKYFGGVRAVDQLHMAVSEGEVLGLIGPNGSGKSTTVNLICGLYPATHGRMVFQGQDITTLPPHVRLSRGIARTFQNIRLFDDLTVWQNLWVAQNSGTDSGGGNPVRRWFSGSRQARREITEMLEFSALSHRADELAGNLSFGEQRRLEMARAMAARPKLLLLDEPAAGMNFEEIKDLDDRIRKLRDSGTTVLLVEHHMELVMAVTDRIVVLNFGQEISEGTPVEVQNDPVVRDAYLGGSEAA